MPELIELSVDEVQVLADTVRSRIVHPSHTPVQAIRAGLAAVNAMRLKAAEATGELAADAPVVIVAAPVHRPRPRKVSTLGVRERSSEWLDVDGDRWRWCFMRNLWQYRPCDPQPWEHTDDVEGWIDCPTGSDGSPSPRYAPFTEVPRA